MQGWLRSYCRSCQCMHPCRHALLHQEHNTSHSLGERWEYLRDCVLVACRPCEIYSSLYWFWSSEGCAFHYQVVGAFLEGGTPEETAAIKKVADERPPAPSDIDMLGLEFAAKL